MSQIPVCRPPDRHPRAPSLRVPADAVDCHTHVFEARFPLSPTRGYTPPEATLDEMLSMHRTLGIDRVVLVQPSVYGTDNSAILEGADRLGDRARAVVALGGDVSDATLAGLHTRGARGVRLNLDNRGGMSIPLAEVPRLAGRIAVLGWHIEFLFPASELVELAQLFRSLPVPVSVGHFGYMPAAEGVTYPPFRLLCDLVREGNTWVKLSAPNRLGVGDLPPWDEVVPLAQALIETDVSRMLWATDWPHPNRYGDQPNDADLLDALARWAPDPFVQHQILVENPAQLYGF